MATTDRYEFVHCMDDGIDRFTDIPAPDPADWQKVVDAVDVWESVVCDLVMGNTEEQAMFNAIATAAVAAVRNMREAQS